MTGKARFRRLRVLLFASVISALPVHPALATDFHWSVAGPANWNVGANWNPLGPPSGGAGDHAFINNGGTAQISADILDIQDIFVGSGPGTSGTLNQSAGTIHGDVGATNGWSFVGDNGGIGTYNLSGGASDNERLFVGRLGGIGTANTSGTGKVEWATNPGAGEFVVGLDAGSTGTVSMSGIAVVNTGFVLFGATGATGNLTMSDDSSITAANVEFDNAQVTITGSATVHANNQLWIGQGAGRSTTVNQSSGVVEAQTWIVIGREGSTGVYNLSGTATLRKLAVGTDDSDSSFITVGAFGTGGGGTLNVQGNATLSSDTGMVLNETAGQAGTVNQSGGTVTLHDFTPQSFQSHLGHSLNIDPNNHGQGAYRLSGGTLNVETVFLGSGVFEMTGGTFSATNFVGNLTQGGGTVSPSDSLRWMQVMGNYSLNSGELLIELDGLTAGTEYQQLLVTGVVSLAGDLTLELGFPPSLGDAFTIIDNRGAGAVSGTFSQGSSITADGVAFDINYGGGDGNDVVLTVIPEPASMALPAVLAALGWTPCRRR